MKKLLLVLCLILVLSAIGGAHALTLNIDATITADNHYGLYTGTANTVDVLIGHNEEGYWDTTVSGDYNWSNPEKYSFTVTEGDYVYIAGWSDGSHAQGILGQFEVIGGNTILTNNKWEKYLTALWTPNIHWGNDYRTTPSAGEVSTAVTGVNWTLVSNTLNHGTGPSTGPWGIVTGISTDADWIWGSSLEPGSTYGEYQVFRKQVSVPEPGTMFLLGSLATGLFGFAGLRRRFTK